MIQTTRLFKKGIATLMIAALSVTPAATILASEPENDVYAATGESESVNMLTEGAADTAETDTTETDTAKTDTADIDTEAVSNYSEDQDGSESAVEGAVTVPEDADGSLSTEEQNAPALEAAYTAYQYYPALTKPSQDTVGGVSTDLIIDKLVAEINQHEGADNSVVANDNGALSLGRMGWHSSSALILMRMVVAADNATAYNILGSTLYNEITTTTSTWSSRILSSGEATRFKQLLSTAAATECEDQLSESYAAMYINRGISWGITNAAALLYIADIENQTGASSKSGSKAVATLACNLAGGWDQITLNDAHIAAICFTYSGKNSWIAASTSNQKAWIGLRDKVYGYASELGWTYCESGDSQITYDTSGSTGIVWLQRALNYALGTKISVTGKLDTPTITAIKTFENYNGLTADGKADQLMVAKLIYKLYYATALSTSSGSSYTGLLYDSSNGTWKYYKNGKYDSTVNSVIKNAYGWWYVKNGVVDFTYTGIAKNSYGWWRIVNGKVDFTYTGVAKNSYGWWYCNNGKVDFTYTGVAKNDYGWWRIVNGKVDFTYTGLAKNSYGWWYCENGKVDFTYTGVAKNSYGWWYCNNGKVDTTYTGVAKNDYGWWYCKNGKVDFTYTGLAKNENGWWYCKNGKVDFTYTGLTKNTNGWWYCKNGQVDFTYTGLAKNDYGWWYCKNGKIDFTYTGLAKNENGWWYCKNGKVDFTYTGFVKQDNSWWYVLNGQRSDTTDKVLIKGTVNNVSGWWYITEGSVNYTFTGIVSNQNGSWYVSDGKVDFSHSGVFEDQDAGISYTIEKGKVTKEEKIISVS